MLFAVAIFMALSVPQEDLAPWILQLGSDVIAEREAATRFLASLGATEIDSLEKAREASKDLEVRARLDSIVITIRKRLELAIVLGPTKRISFLAKGRKLGEILKEVGTLLEVTFKPTDIDLDQVVDIDVQNGTWWETLDRTAMAAGTTYDLEYDDNWKLEVMLAPGRLSGLPVHYVEQFRIAVVEAKRLQRFTPCSKEEAICMVLQVRHQPNVRPVYTWFRPTMRLTLLQDAKRFDCKMKRPNWVGTAFGQNRVLADQQEFWALAEAAFPMTVQGSTDVLLEGSVEDVTLDIGAEGSAVKVGGIRLEVAGFSTALNTSTLTIRAETDAQVELRYRFADNGVNIVDEDGIRHEAALKGGGSGTDRRCEWEIKFENVIRKPKKVVFRWIMEFHKVELPFRLEGIKIP